MRHGDDPGRKLYGGATGVKCNAEIQEVGLAIQDFQSFSIANGSTYIYRAGIYIYDIKKTSDLYIAMRFCSSDLGCFSIL